MLYLTRFGCSRTYTRLAPTVRHDSWPYLVRYGANRTTWLNCAANGAFAYQLCGEVVAAAAADFPRSVNVWVMADGPPAKYNGYAFAGGSATDPLQGHVGLIWQVLNTGECLLLPVRCMVVSPALCIRSRLYR